MMSSDPERILVVDDEPKYVRGIQAILVASGYAVVTAQDGLTAVKLAASERPHLVLLDVRMPGMDGFETCRRIREFSMVPVIMLTAMAATADKVKGLDVGADDYITKPYSAPELLARVKAVLRRAEGSDSPETAQAIQAGDLRIDFVQRRVLVQGNEVHLTATEYRLLAELARRAGQVIASETLLEAVWGLGYEGEDRLVWRSIHRLRQKIEADPQHPRYVETRPGNGYVFMIGN
jgi:two-component system, OmpR family, KDP operon response regulator KdpE